jgi:hypothetical protein
MQNARMQMLPVNIDAAGPDARVRQVLVAVWYSSFHCSRHTLVFRRAHVQVLRDRIRAREQGVGNSGTDVEPMTVDKCVSSPPPFSVWLLAPLH